MDKISMINHVTDGNQKNSFSSNLERCGSRIGTLGHVLFGRTFYKLDNGDLAQPESQLTTKSLLLKIIAVVFLPFTLLSILFELMAKGVAFKIDPDLKDKYQGNIIANYRQIKDMENGKFPSNPWTPNCVNSQENSKHGKLYNADPISVPEGVSDPLAKFKEAISNLYPDALELTQEHGSYLHYEFTVNIPKLGVFKDDVDVYFRAETNKLEIRSASRTGYRDALNLNFSKPGANKKRIEAIREEFMSLFG